MMKVLKISGLVIGILIAGMLIFASFNHVSPLGMVATNEFDTHDDLAISGYDPVSYFVANQAKKGKEEYQFSWRNAIWHFSSADNRNQFIASPEQYAPQFGGYCAFTVGTGFSASADPNNFKIRDNKLYLFNNADVIVEVEEAGQQFWAKATANWMR